MKSLFLWISISVVVSVAMIWFLQVIGMLVEGVVAMVVFVSASYVWRRSKSAARRKAE
jgi:hypothetical protein